MRLKRIKILGFAPCFDQVVLATENGQSKRILHLTHPCPMIPLWTPHINKGLRVPPVTVVPTAVSFHFSDRPARFRARKSSYPTIELLALDLHWRVESCQSLV